MFKTMPMMMRIMMTLAMIMVMGMMVLLVKRIVVQVHHAGEGGGEAHPVGDRAISVQPHHLVLLGHVVQEAEQSFKLSCGYTTNCFCGRFVSSVVISRNCTILFC